MHELVTDIGIDMDGVVFPFAEAFQNWWEVETDSLELDPPAEWDFYRSWGITDKEFPELLARAAGDGVFSGLPPYEGVVEGWQELRSFGVRIHVVTHRPREAWAQTATWLENHGLIADTLSFMYDKTVLSYLSQGRSAMVEDRPEFIVALDSAGVIPFIMDQPWNQGDLPGHRVFNMVEFAEKIRGLV